MSWKAMSLLLLSLLLLLLLALLLLLYYLRSCGACAGSGGPRADVQEAGGQDGGGDALQGPGYQRHPLYAPNTPLLRQNWAKSPEAPSGNHSTLLVCLNSCAAAAMIAQYVPWGA